MAEVTVTRATLRRKIARQLMYRFPQYVGDSSTFSGTPTTTAMADPVLVQGADFWNQSWVYDVANDESRIATDFGGGTLTTQAFSTAPSAGATYEIHDYWNAGAIHQAINRAIEDGWPAFFDQVTDETLILEEDKLAYTISSLSSAPWLVLQMWVEKNTSVLRGEVESSTSTTLTDTGAGFTSVDSNWRVSIYAGTGSGDLRTGSSGTADTVTVTSAWSSNPDTTSKYAAWDTSNQIVDWRRVYAVRFDQKEFPNIMYLTRRYPVLYGLRMRLIYLAKPAQLSADSDTTVVPEEFIIAKACSILHDMAVNDNRVDRQRHASLAEYYDQLARDYMQRRAFQMPASTLWQERDEASLWRETDLADPLGWEYGE